MQRAALAAVMARGSGPAPHCNSKLMSQHLQAFVAMLEVQSEDMITQPPDHPLKLPSQLPLLINMPTPLCQHDFVHPAHAVQTCYTE